MKEQEIETTTAKPIIRPTPDEDAAINAQIAAAPDDFELDRQWFQDAKPTKELFPVTYQKAMQRKSALESGAIQNIQITLPSAVVNWFKAQTSLDGATGGTAWIDLIEQTLAAYVSARAGALMPTPHPPSPPARIKARHPCPSPPPTTASASASTPTPWPPGAPWCWAARRSPTTAAWPATATAMF